MAEQITTPETGSETPLDATAAIEAMLYPSESNDKPEEKQAEVADEPDDTLSEDDIEEVESETEEEVVLEDDTEESNDVEDDTEDETTELEEEQTFTIKAAGEEKEVTIDELVKSYQMEADYTKKTQSLAEDRKKVEAYGDVIKMAEHTRNEYANRLQALEQVLQGNTESHENLAELKENDPIGYAVKVAEMTEKKDQLSLVKAEQDCATPKQSSWIKSEVYTITTDNFKKTAGKDGMKYLKKRTYPGEVMNGMLVYMADNQAEGADAAIEFLKKHEDVWTKWVPGKVAKKVKAAL